jgi:hypothetical protein
MCVGCPDCYCCRCLLPWGDRRPDVHSAIYSMGAIRLVDPVRVERSESMSMLKDSWHDIVISVDCTCHDL